MKRIETLVREAMADLDQAYVWTPVNGVQRLEIAKAVDKIREAEKTLRRAYDTPSDFGTVEA